MELFTIVFGTERFHQYTYERQVSVESDHKPLEIIFGKHLASAPWRLQRMLMRLRMYDLRVRYKKGTALHLAHTLIWHYLTIAEGSREGEETLNCLSDLEREEEERVEIRCYLVKKLSICTRPKVQNRWSWRITSPEESGTIRLARGANLNGAIFSCSRWVSGPRWAYTRR